MRGPFVPSARALALAFALAAALIGGGCRARHATPATPVAPRIGARQTGIASWYGDPYHGRATASGEIYDMELATAAHRRFAFGTWLRVDNLDNGQRTEVRVNDRGPFHRGRIVDLSRAAAREAGLLAAGTARVRLTVIAPRRVVSPRTWFVQVASFRDAALARDLVARLTQEGRAAQARESGEWTRVIVAAAPRSNENIGGDEERAARALAADLQPRFPGAHAFSTSDPQNNR